MAGVSPAHSVASRNNVGALDHQDHRSFRRARAMTHALGNNKALPRAEIDNTIFKVNEEISIENEKEFIDVLVLMPVVLTLHYCHPDDAVVDLATRLIVPLVRVYHLSVHASANFCASISSSGPCRMLR